jgi:hypothetical protein
MADLASADDRARRACTLQSPDAIRLFLFSAAMTSGGNCGLVTLFIAGCDSDSDSSDRTTGDGIAALTPATIATIHAPIAKVIHGSTFGPPPDFWAQQNNRTTI